MRTGLRAALTAAFACLMLPAAQAGAVTPVVLIEDNNADLNTCQALNQTVTASKDKDGSNFIRFGENLLPPTLRGGEGKADTFPSRRRPWSPRPCTRFRPPRSSASAYPGGSGRAQ